VLLQPQEEKQVYVRHQVRILKVTEAWRYLICEARRLAQLAGSKVQPHDLILSKNVWSLYANGCIYHNFLAVTRSMKAQIYIAKHFGQPPFMHGHSAHTQHSFGRPGAPPHPMHHPGNAFAHQNSHFSHRAPPPPFPGQIPQMMHLFTSPRPDFEPFWTEDPSMAMAPVEQRRHVPRFVTTRLAWCVTNSRIHSLRN
jgi:hypothetical protein